MSASPEFQTLEESLFRPTSVGFIGLSSDPAKPAGRVLPFLLREGFTGGVWVVNPRRDVVQGQRAYPSLQALPEVPQHVYILLGTGGAEQAVRDCAEAGVAVATIVADGFAESGPEGRALQDRITGIARDAGLRLLGPNSMGVADLNARFLFTVNAIYAEPDHIAGTTGLISQSGSMMGGLISRAKALGLGFSRVAAVGNECDLGVAEIGHMMIADPNTRVISLFLETIRDADSLARLAAAAHVVGKPVIAYKLGRSSLGQQMAVAHTGALLAEDDVTDAFFRDCGIVRVTTLDGLIEAPPLFAGRTPPERSPKIGVLTTTGGGAATVCDRLSLEDVELVPPSPATREAVAATGLSASFGAMVDLTMAGAGPDYVRPTVEAIARDPEVDLILSVTGSSGRSAPERTVAPLAEADLQGKPLAAFITPDTLPTLNRLLEAGIPAFRTPEGAADVIGAYCRWQAPRITGLSRPPSAVNGCLLDEYKSLNLLKDIGFPVVESAVLKIGDAPALPLPYPVVAKVLSDRVAHKTEAGGVITGIADAAALVEAGQRVKASVEAYHPGLEIDEILVAPMIRPLQEVLIGYRLDPQIGPVVTLAPGGILVGLYDDKAIRCAPVDTATALEMISEVKALAPIRGHRGLPRGDLEALAAAIVVLSNLATHQPAILEAEANPVMVLADEVVAVDALVTLEGDPA